MSIRAVIWDFGGVLLRTEDYAGRERLAQRLGKSRQELEDLVFSSVSGTQAQLGKISDDENWENVRLSAGLSSAELADFQTDFWSGDRLDEGLIRLIQDLRPAHKIGLLSNNYPSLRSALQDRWKIADIFDVIIISAEVGLLKPDERIYRLALDQLDLAPEETVFIDDFAHNLIGAQKVGMRTILFQNAAQVRADLQQLLESQPDPGD